MSGRGEPAQPARRLGLALLGILAGLPAAALGAEHAVEACRPLYPRVGDTGERVVGVEDIAVDRETGLAYLSAYDRRDEADSISSYKTISLGGIFELDLRNLSDGDKTVRVRDLTRRFAAAQPFRPQGIDLYRGPDGRASLFVVNRAGGGGEARLPSVEIFDLADGAARHRGPRAGTRRDPLLCSANDVVALDRERFFATNDHGACGWLGRLLEDTLTGGRAAVVFYDGARFHRVADGLGFANGIALSREPGARERPGRLFVAATRARALHVFRLRWRGDDPVPRVEPSARLALADGPDNLTWGSDGLLYVATLPELLRYAVYRTDLFPVERTPSRVVAIDVRSRAPPRTVFSDAGDRLSGSTVAVRDGARLLVGAAFESHLLLCRLQAAEGRS